MNAKAFAARTAGFRSAMEPADRREVPAEYQDYSEEWLQGYDSMSVAVRTGFASLLIVTPNHH